MINKTISLLLTMLMLVGAQVKYPVTVKILSIGNSFSEDALYYLYDIAESAGVNVVAGNLYYSGCSLKIHDENAKKNIKAYSYHKWTSEGMTIEEDKTMKEVILDEKWDYITFQQSSEDSGLYVTYQPYLNNLINYVKSLRPNAKFALNMTWAYSEDSRNNGFAKYNYSQFNMYRSITEAYKQALDETEIDIIIPCGTAIQNGRTSEDLNDVGDQLTRDGYHLNEEMGRYIAGLTFFEALIVRDKSLDINIYDDVTFIPGSKTDTEELLVSIAKKAVIEAMKNPYKNQSRLTSALS